MSELFGSVRGSLLNRFSSSSGDDDGGSRGGVGSGGGSAGGGRLTEKIGSYVRKSMVEWGLGSLGLLPTKHSSPPHLPSPPQAPKDSSPTIRWRKGELIGCGAFGHVYMGMNLDSGELLAVKQVLIGTSGTSKEKAQAHVRELEEEVKLLKNLSHPNIVRYLGTVREDDTLNILLEFVPGGSISSLLGKFDSFPEAVIRMYTKQLLHGLEYLHQNGIIHRDIKGANILVDNKGCIKLADFGASKQVAKLATMTAAKSMKGTPYWMAPEVILQTGHSFSADIWSVGCTFIEMATGKPPWSQQYQEVAVLYHIGTTKSHPPIPEHLSLEAKDFLLKCLQKEPSSRPTASDLLQHPFVAGDVHGTPLCSVMDSKKDVLFDSRTCLSKSPMTTCMKDIDDFASESTENLFHTRPLWETCDSGDMNCLGGKDESLAVGSSFNPMSEPFDEWPCKFQISPERQRQDSKVFDGLCNGDDSASVEVENEFCIPCGPICEDDDEATETKIRAFLDEKALELTKLQTPLYEFFNTLNASNPSGAIDDACAENVTNNYYAKLPPRSKCSPSNAVNGPSASFIIDASKTSSPVSCSRRLSSNCGDSNRILKEIPSQKLNEWSAGITSLLELRRKWTEELNQELERVREMSLKEPETVREMSRKAVSSWKNSSPRRKV